MFSRFSTNTTIRPTHRSLFLFVERTFSMGATKTSPGRYIVLIGREKMAKLDYDEQQPTNKIQLTPA